MKKTIILLTLASLACGCNFLDTYPKSEISDGNMWTTPALSKAGMDGLMYPFVRRDLNSLNDLVKSDGKGGINRIGIEGWGYTSILDAGSQLAFLRDASKKASGIDNMAEWRSLYTAIHACNKAIAHLNKDVVGEDLFNQYICEARLIRAFSYSRLNMIYGEVPIYLEETDNEQCTKTQNTWDEVWTMVINECTECINNPSFQQNNFSGERIYKPSKGMAYALRGNAYMWLAANKNPEIYYGSAGISDTEIKAYYQKAAADFQKVKECGFGLWKGAWEDLFTEANEHNSEMIFPLEFSTSSGYESVFVWAISCRSNLSGWNRLVASTQFVDDFEWADGTKFDWSQVFPDWYQLTEKQREVFFLRDSLDFYHEQVEHGTSVEKYITLNANREKCLDRIGQTVWDNYYLNDGNEARLRTAFDTRDPRLNKAVVTPYKPYKMFNSSANASIDFVFRWPRFKQQDKVPGSDTWLEFSANMVYPWYKYMVGDGSIIIRYDGVDWPLLRYTQIQLMWAEALAQTGDLTGACSLLNEIRARAGMPDVSPSSLDSVMEEIRYETRVELCLEGKDFFNEIRWNTFKETKFQGEDYIDPKSCWGSGGWKTGYYYVDGMWPVSAPLTEIVMNTNLKRRPKCWVY